MEAEKDTALPYAEEMARDFHQAAAEITEQMSLEGNEIDKANVAVFNQLMAVEPPSYSCPIPKDKAYLFLNSAYPGIYADIMNRALEINHSRKGGCMCGAHCEHH